MLVSAWTFGVVFAGLSVACEFLKPWGLENVGLSLFFVGISIFFVRQFGTGRIELYPDAVVFDGWLRPRREVPLAKIEAVEPGPYGLFFRTGPHEGVSGTSQIGAKGLGLALLKVRARGDRIAAAVMAAAKPDSTS
jgi:hypothetical protein